VLALGRVVKSKGRLTILESRVLHGVSYLYAHLSAQVSIPDTRSRYKQLFVTGSRVPTDNGVQAMYKNSNKWQSSNHERVLWRMGQACASSSPVGFEFLIAYYWRSGHFPK
jgi:hypothetical protein